MPDTGADKGTGGDAGAKPGRALRIGMLTPSSNIALEPATYALLRAMPGVSAHFARFPVTEIALSPGALGQFDQGPILAAAELLSHARMDAIVWNGTSATWLGFARDEALVEAVTARTGIAGATSILAMNTLLGRMNAKRIGIVTPYTADVQAKLVANYEAAGFVCAAERHAGLRDNFSFAELPEAEIEALVMDVAEASPDAIAVICTNMDATRLAPRIESRIGIPVLDSIAMGLWGALDLLGVPKGPLHDAGAGEIFRY
jgi:maleate isomerase